MFHEYKIQNHTIYSSILSVSIIPKTPLKIIHMFPIIFSLLTFNLLLLQAQTLELCPSIFCNNRRVPIQFPFRVPENQTYRCGYPGFELSCDSKGQTILPLSPSSHLIVRGISYPDQLLWVSDPNHCIPKRVLNLPLRSTPFRYGTYEYPNYPYTYLNCTGSNNTKIDLTKVPKTASVISCMSEGNNTVVITADEKTEEKMMSKEEWKCGVIRRGVNAAFWWPQIEYGIGMYGMDISHVFLELSWDAPNCGDCSLRGGSCGLVGDFGLEVACFLPAPSGLPKSAKYGLILGAGVPGLLCIVGIIFYISSKASARNQNRRYTNTESSPSIFPQPIILTLGLDRPTIESYPKTILGESKRLPKPSDNMCPICLSEYQAKETLRSIPECNHYFHADCIDEWLRMNATCPLCRNSPQQPSVLDGC